MDIMAIGSGGAITPQSAAMALLENTDLSARRIDCSKKALNIAAGICVYTNNHLTIEDARPAVAHGMSKPHV